MLVDAGKIRTAIENNIEALTLRPADGIGTSTTTASLVGGFRCEVSEGRWKLLADLPPSEGGDDTGPTPGVLGRGALASCLAMGIVIQASRMDIALDALTVEVQCDWDAGAALGLSDGTPPGYTQVRIGVRIQSSASEDRLRELVSSAERCSSYVDVFRRATNVEVAVQAISVS